MQKIQPYNSSKAALTALDNGGYFYNIFTKANDGVITKAELSKVGQVAMLVNGKQQGILFLAMAIQQLNEAEQSNLLRMLDDDLKQAYQKYKPEWMLPSEALATGTLSSSAVLTGIPRLVDSKEDFTGFIMIPIIINNVTSFTMVPIIEQYDVYELRDEVSSEKFIIAHLKGKTKLPEQRVQIGGVIKELKAGNNKGTSERKFLEGLYYTFV